jgi:hypothetical protein
MVARKRKKNGHDTLLYKVIELSAVDERSIESVINEWVPRGWKFDGVQFAMRESSKRPSMAFVFFTKVGEALETIEATRAAPMMNAYDRLRALAEGGDES